MNDLRSFLNSLKRESATNVVTIEEPVQADFEIAAIVKGFEATTNPVVIFQKVQGFSFPVVVNATGSRDVAFAFTSTLKGGLTDEAHSRDCIVVYGCNDQQRRHVSQQVTPVLRVCERLNRHDSTMHDARPYREPD